MYVSRAYLDLLERVLQFLQSHAVTEEDKALVKEYEAFLDAISSKKEKTLSQGREQIRRYREAHKDDEEVQERIRAQSRERVKRYRKKQKAAKKAAE